MRGVLVFNETGNGHRREAGCQHRVTAPSQFLSHIHKSPQDLKISLSMGPPRPKKSLNSYWLVDQQVIISILNV